MGLAVIFTSILILSVFSPLLEGKKKCFNKVTGIVPPVFTPVDDDGKVNLDIIPKYAQYLKDQDMDGVLVAGTLGEGPTLNVTDKKNLIDAWVHAAGSLNLTVIMQVGGIPLPDAQELAAYAEAAGVDGILTLPELYYRPKTARQLVYFMQQIAKFAPNTPLYYYQIPEYTNVNVDMVEFFKLATEMIPSFKGLKCEDFQTALLLQDKVTEEQTIFFASGFYLPPAIFMGFENFILSEPNLFPELIKDLISAGKKADLKKTRSLYRRLMELNDVIAREGKLNASMKAAMCLITGIEIGPIRPPQIPLTRKEIKALENRLKAANVTVTKSA